MTPAWEILPHLGIGPLRFGMTRDEAVAAGTIFGPVTHESVQDEDYAFITLAQAMGEAEARALVDTMMQDGIETRPRHLVAFGDALQIDLYGDALTMVRALPQAHDVHVDGVRLFETDPVPALLRLQTLNGAPPLMHERSCLFDALNLSTWDLAVISKKRGLRLATPMSGQGLTRSLDWGSVSPVGKDLLPNYARVDLTPLAATS